MEINQRVRLWLFLTIILNSCVLIKTQIGPVGVLRTFTVTDLPRVGISTPRQHSQIVDTIPVNENSGLNFQIEPSPVITEKSVSSKNELFTNQNVSSQTNDKVTIIQSYANVNEPLTTKKPKTTTENTTESIIEYLNRIRELPPKEIKKINPITTTSTESVIIFLDKLRKKSTPKQSQNTDSSNDTITTISNSNLETTTEKIESSTTITLEKEPSFSSTSTTMKSTTTKEPINTEGSSFSSTSTTMKSTTIKEPINTEGSSFSSTSTTIESTTSDKLVEYIIQTTAKLETSTIESPTTYTRDENITTEIEIEPITTYEMIENQYPTEINSIESTTLPETKTLEDIEISIVDTKFSLTTSKIVEETTESLRNSSQSPPSLNNSSESNPIKVAIMSSILGLLGLLAVALIITYFVCRNHFHRKNIYATMEHEPPKVFTNPGPPVILKHEVPHLPKRTFGSVNVQKITEL